MIPILWRHLLSGYLKIFFLSMGSFIAVLFVSRFKEIARFAALSEDIGTTGFFILIQIPLILPVALPIAMLMSAILVVQNMNQSFELTALRTSGLKIFTIFAPLLLFAVCASFLHFSCTNSLSPACRRAAKSALYYETSSNPLHLLQRQNLIKTKKSFLKMEPSSQDDAKSLFFVMNREDSLLLVHAQKIWTEKELLKGNHIAILSHLGTTLDETFDPLFIENEREMTTDVSTLTASLKKKRPHLDAGSLELPMLQLRSFEKGSIGRKASIEIARRNSLSLAMFSFTLLGIAFSIQTGRIFRKKELMIAILLALFCMLSYLLAKEFRKNPFLAYAILLIPHLCIWVSSSIRLYRIERGLI